MIRVVSARSFGSAIWSRGTSHGPIGGMAVQPVAAAGERQRPISQSGAKIEANGVAGGEVERSSDRYGRALRAHDDDQRRTELQVSAMLPRCADNALMMVESIRELRREHRGVLIDRVMLRFAVVSIDADDLLRSEHRRTELDLLDRDGDRLGRDLFYALQDFLYPINGSRLDEFVDAR